MKQMTFERREPRCHGWGFIPWRVLVSGCCALFALSSLSGCSSKDKTREPGEQGATVLPLAPLEAKPLAARDFVRVEVPLGSVEPRPVLLVLAEEESGCAPWTTSLVGPSFILCSWAAPESGTELLRATLREVKTSYGAHVRRPPVVLIAEPAQIELGLSWMGEEPKFFSEAILFLASPEQLPSTFLHSFSSRGGQAVVAVVPSREGTERLDVSLRALPLKFRWVSADTEAPRRAWAALLGSRAPSQGASPGAGAADP